MSPNRILYVGTPELAQHHADALQQQLGGAVTVAVMPPGQVIEEVQPGDICLFYNECQPEIRQALDSLTARQIPTLLVPDGILEWRSAWEGGSPQGWMRPVLAHKVACIGQAQARILTTWGNRDKCEVVGMARLDTLLNRSPRIRQAGEPFRLLVMTAKNPGFTPKQRRITGESLLALRSWLDAHPNINGMPVEVVWRIAPSLAGEIGFADIPLNTDGQELAGLLGTVDAVISTPSTAQLEAMLMGLPVATLDFHNVPPYLPATWMLSAPTQFESVIPQLLAPSPEKMAFQQAVLHDQLECKTPAGPRLVALIQTMHTRAQECRANGEPLSFPITNSNLTAATVPDKSQLDILRVTAQNQERTIADLSLKLDMAQQDVKGLQERLERYERYSVLGRLARLRRKQKGVPN